MKLNFSLLEKKALVGIAGVGLFVATAVWQIGRRNFWFEAKNTYHTRVVDADGLRIGSSVTISGLRVGEVSNLEVEEDNHIHVTMEVKRSVAGRIREGAVANIFRAFIIGEKKIDIVPGAESGRTLANNGIIVGKEATDLSEFLSGRKLSEIMAQVDGLLTGITGALHDTNQLFAKYKSGEMNQAIDMVLPALTNFIKLSDDIIVMTQELKKKNKEIPKLVDAGASVLQRVDHDFLNNGLAKEFVDAGTGALKRIDKDLLQNQLMAHAFKSMDDTMQNVNTVMIPIAQRHKVVGGLLDNLADLSSELKKDPQYGAKLLETVSELTVTLKALQNTWFLEDQARDAKKQQKLKYNKKPPGKALSK